MTGDPQWLRIITPGELHSVPARYAIPRVASDGEMARLAAFRAAHPGVAVELGDFGTWQAVIPAPNDGETFAARHTLGELLDRLGELIGEQ
ncbi:MAG: hypothetical protein ACRDRJ_15105 [Streptosporangiaceae bacterium]